LQLFVDFREGGCQFLFEVAANLFRFSGLLDRSV
jgi:hypothetical protein